jgi:superfamily II DNA/RNA helicase
MIFMDTLGRTGRAGKLGTAITFLTNDDDEVMWVDACPYVFGLVNVYLSLSLRSGTTSSKVRS